MSTAIPKGFASAAYDHVETSIDFQRLLIRHPTATFFIKAKGEGMNPVIRNGDLLVVDRSVDSKDGNIIVAALNGDLLVKYLFKRGGILTLLAANPDYSPIDVTTGFDFHIWGVVTYVIHNACTPS